MSGSAWGEIEIIDEVVESAHTGFTRYVWRPAAALAQELPAGYRLEFECHLHAGGARRFLPVASFAHFVMFCCPAGLAMLARDFGMNEEMTFSYRAASLVYQKSTMIREHLGRQFACEADLKVRKAGQPSHGSHILPDSLGSGNGGGGDPWTPARLLAEGRAEARARQASQDIATVIRLGLLAGAKLAPIDPESIAEQQGLALVRGALFDLGPAGTIPDPKARSIVEERFLAALERHIGDTTEEFNRWFFETHDNLIHAIAKQKKHGGVLAREVVRQILADLIFRSFRYVGDCVHYFMTTFANALENPLSDAERGAFESMYSRQRWLGDLPLILLHDRFDFLREGLIDLWESPEPASRGTILRLLTYYSEITASRRSADRQIKRSGSHPTAVVRRGRTKAASDSGTLDDGFQIVAEWLREQRSASCRCSSTRAWVAFLAEATEHNVTIEDGCAACGDNFRHQYPMEEYERAARTALGELGLDK